jgi:predicted sulfurtransferase
MQVPTPTDASELQMLSFYKFHELSNPVSTRDALFDSLMDLPGLRGTLYVAAEGINAQVAVPPIHLDEFLSTVRENLPCTVNPNLGNVVNIEVPTFDRFIVRTRNAVLRDGLDSALDWENAGDELTAEQWHGELRNAPSFLLDCRNSYESEYGSFRDALPLETDVFSESWERLEKLTANVDKETPVHIFCTGGIRCVKVGAFLKQKLGFRDVRRLEHGIIGYEKWANDNSAESIWEGENFLFDKRRILDAKDECMEQNSDGTSV